MSSIIGIFWYNLKNKRIVNNLEKITKKNIIWSSSWIDLVIINKHKKVNIEISKEAFLLGNIFTKDGRKVRNSDIKNIFTENIEITLEQFWGRYILIKKDEKNRQIQILKDPIGQIPLFFHTVENICTIFSTDIKLLFDISNSQKQWNWHYLSNYLINGGLTSKSSPFLNIHELPSGCKLELSNNKKVLVDLVWNPLNYCKNKNSELDILHNINNVLYTVLKSWTGNFNEIILEFSGGLDSSAILFTLKDILSRTNKNLKPLNIYDSITNASNELHYANQICLELNIKLNTLSSDNILPFNSTIPIDYIPNKPHPFFTYLKMEKAILELADKSKLTTYISGQGGDEVFMCPPAIDSISDLILDGSFSELMNKTKILSGYYRIPATSIAMRNFKSLGNYFMKLPPCKYQNIDNPEKTPWLKKITFDIAKNPLKHPFYEKILKHRISPGKYVQIDSIFQALNLINQDVISWENARFYPLITQPIIELALSIPSYKLYNNDYDRYLLRKAISDHYKTNLVWRKDKGETSGTFQRALKENINYVIDLCCEGQMAQKGLIDKDLLYKNLKIMSNSLMHFQWQITYLTSLEEYMKYWE